MIIITMSEKWWSDRYDRGYDVDNHNHDDINTSN